MRSFLIIVGFGGILAGFTISWTDNWGIAGHGWAPLVFGLFVFFLFLCIAIIRLRYERHR